MTGSARDPHDLQRFVEAQSATYAAALGELRAGRKRSHWMWFVFPQIAGLGSSPTAKHYAIGSAEEARAYLAHPLLGARLRECTAALLKHGGRSAAEMLGGIDALKLASSMTLFEAVGGGAGFGACVDQFFAGKRDVATLRSAALSA